VKRILLSALCVFVISFSSATHATIIESGDLNFISDVGNPSDGLAFLDMTFSTGMTSAAALANAQLTYADARLATPDEFDDLFLAAGVAYTGTSTASDAFAAGNFLGLTAPDAAGTALKAALGTTSGLITLIWTDPDGSSVSTTTRDYLELGITGGAVAHQISGVIPPHGQFGWLLVSDAAVVPEPSTGILVALGVLGLGIRRRGSLGG